MIPKFRAWDKKTKTMYEVKSIVFTLQSMLCVNRKAVHPERTLYLDDDDTILMQSTGLFDKNGVEIFDGNIVKVDGWKTEVVKFGKIIHEEDFGGFAIYQGFSLMLGGGYPEAVMNEIEVIGNIYELESVEE